MASTLPLRSFSISGSIDGFSVCKRAANQIPAAQGVSAMPISMAIAVAAISHSVLNSVPNS